MENLRIILTEECDLACRYCRRSGNAAQAERSAVLAAAKGAERVELAGGEPLLWPDVCGLVRELKAQPGTEWVGLTTNGTRLAPLVPELAKAGLDGVNLHLDTCNAFDFAAITGREQVMNDILNGLWAAVARGIPGPCRASCCRRPCLRYPSWPGSPSSTSSPSALSACRA